MHCIQEHIYIVQTFIRAFTLDEEGQANPIQGKTTSIADIEGVLSSIIYDKVRKHLIVEVREMGWTILAFISLLLICLFLNTEFLIPGISLSQNDEEICI